MDQDPKPQSTEAPRPVAVPTRADPDVEQALEDERIQLQEEIAHTLHPGYARRRGWLEWCYQQYANKLAMGLIEDEKVRLRMEGRCQMLNDILTRDAVMTERLRQISGGDEEEDRGEEGGDHGLFYEAST